MSWNFLSGLQEQILNLTRQLHLNQSTQVIYFLEIRFPNRTNLEEIVQIYSLLTPVNTWFRKMMQTNKWHGASESSKMQFWQLKAVIMRLLTKYQRQQQQVKVAVIVIWCTKTIFGPSSSLQASKLHSTINLTKLLPLKNLQVRILSMTTTRCFRRWLTRKSANKSKKVSNKRRTPASNFQIKACVASMLTSCATNWLAVSPKWAGFSKSSRKLSLRRSKVPQLQVWTNGLPSWRNFSWQPPPLANSLFRKISTKTRSNLWPHSGKYASLATLPCFCCFKIESNLTCWKSTTR